RLRNRPAVASHRPSHFYDEARAYPIWSGPVSRARTRQPHTQVLEVIISCDARTRTAVTRAGVESQERARRIIVVRAAGRPGWLRRPAATADSRASAARRRRWRAQSATIASPACAAAR